MFTFNSDNLIRFEFFGGILINKKTFNRYELNMSEAILLQALKLSKNLEDAIEIHDKLIYKKEYDIEKFKEMNVIINKNETVKEFYDADIKKIVNSISEKIKKVKKYNFLSAPLELVIYPTMKCNLNCKFCFVKNKNKNIKEIDSKEWIKMITEAKDEGILSVSILGGEPALYKEIDELLIGIDKLGINATITTNGTMLKDSTKQILVKAKNIIPVISLQSLNDKNQYLMGVDYKKILKTIDYFIDNKKKVRVNSVYTNQTVEEIYEMIDYMVSKGIDRYSIATYVKTNDSNIELKNRSLLDSRKLNELMENYINNKHYNKKINFAVEGCLLYSAYPEIMNEINELSEFDKLYYGCRAGNTKLEIYSNGDVYPCICYENINKPTSNILDNSISDIWINDVNSNKIRNLASKNKTCLGCGFYQFCKGGCPANKEKLFGKNFNNHKDPMCVVEEN